MKHVMVFYEMKIRLEWLNVICSLSDHLVTVKKEVVRLII